MSDLCRRKGLLAVKKSVADEIEDLREATRDAHAAVKDLRKVMGEWRAMKKEVEGLTEKAITEYVEPAVEVGLEAYQGAIMTAIERAEDAVYERFDKIANVLITGAEEEGAAQGDDRPSLEDYAQAIAVIRRERQTIVIPEVKS
jgi:hypothetical protein